MFISHEEPGKGRKIKFRIIFRIDDKNSLRISTTILQLECQLRVTLPTHLIAQTTVNTTNY
ncbi:hypothetical protein NBRC116591_17150 [Sessilibacter corallicola]|uniref:Uncharacterized protein n=1 Tax=Sessilibacter corallicola TaxID=2904075 RepID=A0ABQ0A8D0_9GAMM